MFLWRDESQREYRGEERSGSIGRHGSKTKEIFGSKSESGFKLGHKIETQDEYDVDQNGNLKGSSSLSKKHQRGDDDDGYVEL